MVGQVQWADLTVAAAFILGLLVGIVIVLRVARVGAHIVDRYIEHRLRHDGGDDDKPSPL
jgi:hypothetical protein